MKLSILHAGIQASNNWLRLVAFLGVVLSYPPVHAFTRLISLVN